jgi:hypothetical protein
VIHRTSFVPETIATRRNKQNTIERAKSSGKSTTSGFYSAAHNGLVAGSSPAGPTIFNDLARMFIFNNLARMFVLFTRECSRSVQEYRWPIVGQADSQGRSVNQCSARVLRAHMLQDSLPVHPRKPGAPLWMGNRNRRPQPGEELGSQLGQAGAFAAIGLATPSTRVLRIGFYVGSGTLRLRYRFRSITRARLG